MSNRTLLAAELARRIPALQADCAVNNEALIKGLLEQYLGPEFPQPTQGIPAEVKTYGIDPKTGEQLPIVAEYLGGKLVALDVIEPRNLARGADWINNPVPVPAFER